MSSRRLLAASMFASALVASSSWPLVQGALARDHGVMGQTWGIAEPDLLTTIDGRLKALQANGGIERMQATMRANAENRVRNPLAVSGIMPVREAKSWTFDPSIVLDRDLRDVKGNLVAAAGTRVNVTVHHHRGVDIAAAAGTQIRAPASGRVVKNEFQEGGAGNYLVLQHSDGSQSKYFHMQDRSAFPVGSSIEAGSVLGRVGTTGRSTGPHLHYELWKDGAPVDPKKYQLKNGRE